MFSGACATGVRMTEGSLWGGWQASPELREHQAAGACSCLCAAR